jgi:hypothetical protein
MFFWTTNNKLHDAESSLMGSYVAWYSQNSATGNYTDPAESIQQSPIVFGLASWSENCKWYSSLPLDAVESLFCETV